MRSSHYQEGSDMKFVHQLTIATLFFSIAAAHALEFKSVGAEPAVMYDAPSFKGRKISVAPRGMPVEVVIAYGDWSKVRDATGELSWIESKALSPKRNVVASIANLKVRASADDSSSTVLMVDKDVLLELAEPIASGWIKVKHRDGLSGYVKATEVWGN